MAVSTSSYFSNSIQGQPGLGADIDIYESSTTPKYAVGFGFQRADGNRYRYCHFGALTAVGLLAASDVSESNRTKIENVGCVLANRTKRAGEFLNPNVYGSRYMQLVITATSDQFAGGYLTVTTGSGAGYTYRIAGNTATSDGIPVTGNIYLDLNDPIFSEIDSNSDIAIAGSPYANLEGATTTDAVPVGVTVVGNSASSYGWVCAGGVVAVLQDANIGSVGNPVYMSSNTTGAIMSLKGCTTSAGALALYPSVGYIVEAGSSADYSLVNLQLV